MNIQEKLLRIQNKLKVPKNQPLIGVYAILNPKSQIYIGSSNNIERRFYQYRGLYESSQPKLFNSLKKYGPENHNFIVLEYCELENLFKKEREWGEYFNSLDREKGLNLMLPRCGDIKTAMSEETKAKIGKAHRGKALSKEHRKALLNSVKGKKQTPEHIEKRKMVGERNPAYGKAYFKGMKHTEQTKMKMSEVRKGKNKYGTNSNAKKVLDKETNIIYGSAKEVSEIYEINYSTLKAWLQGVNKGNGRFEYIG